MAFAIMDGRSRFWQWDLGQKLVVYDDTCGQVHFCNGTTECALVRTIYTLEDGTRVVDVPDIILQTAKPFTAYLYRVDADSRETMRSYRFEVAARSKPADYGYVEPEGEGGSTAGGGLTTAQINLLDSLFSAIPWTTGTAGALADSLIASLRATSSGSGSSGGGDTPDAGETDNITQSGNTLIITSLATAPTQSGSVLTIA